MKRILQVFLSLTVVAWQLLAVAAPASAASSITITSPTSGATMTDSSFTVTGTATANRTITLKVDGTTVGSTTSDASGDWSTTVSNVGSGAKTLEATASTDLLYTNVLNASSFATSRMSIINTQNNQEERSFSIFASSAFPIIWKPNPTFTQAYGTSPYLFTNTIWVMDLVNGTTSTFTMSGGGATPGSIAYNSDGSKVYISDAVNDVVHVYDTSDNSEITTISVGDGPLSLTHQPGTKYVVNANSNGNTITVIDTETDTVVTTLPTGTQPNALAFNKEGTRLYISIGNNGDIQVMDASDGTILDTITGTPGAASETMIVNDAGTRAYTTHPTSNHIDVFDLEAGSLLDSVTVPPGPWSVALSTDNAKLYVTSPNLLGGLSGTAISVIDTSSNTIVDTITPGTGGPLFNFIQHDSVSTSVTITVGNSAVLANTGSNVQAIQFIASALIISSLYLIHRRRTNTIVKL